LYEISLPYMFRPLVATIRRQPNILWWVAQSIKIWNQETPFNTVNNRTSVTYVVAKVSIITTTEELLKESPRQQIQKRAVTLETQKENPSRRWSPYGSTRTYLRERTDQKRGEYNRRVQNDEEEKTINASARFGIQKE
jgi:hypothetical protein